MKVYPIFSFKHFVILALMLKSLICLELIFMSGLKCKLASFFCVWVSVTAKPFSVCDALTVSVWRAGNMPFPAANFTLCVLDAHYVHSGDTCGGKSLLCAPLGTRTEDALLPQSQSAPIRIPGLLRRSLASDCHLYHSSLATATITN